MIKVTNEVNVYEVNGSEPKPGERPTVLVRSHWNRSNLVVLEIGDLRLAVTAADLQAAIRNATNTGSL